MSKCMETLFTGVAKTHGVITRRSVNERYSTVIDAATISIHSSNDVAGQLLSTRSELASYGRGVPPNQLNQPLSGIRTSGTSNSLIANSASRGKSDLFGRCDL